MPDCHVSIGAQMPKAQSDTDFIRDITFNQIRALTQNSASETMSERQRRISLKRAQIISLKKEAGKHEALFRRTGNPYFANKCASNMRVIAGLSWDLEFLRDIKTPTSPSFPPRP